MSHNTKINAIFVDIKAGDCSVSVHILNFELFLQITKIVTKSTQEGTEISASALFFILPVLKSQNFYLNLRCVLQASIHRGGFKPT